jgi:F0F1-type ATP synthase assembly protein I
MAKRKSQKRAKRSSSAPRRAARRSSGASANLVGKVLFIAGVILALLAGLVPNLEKFPWVVWALVILGLLVGILNITRDEQTQFLAAGIGLLIASTAVTALLPNLGTLVANILKNVIAFVAPTVLIVSVIAIANLARD